MNILDENIADGQRELLRSLGIPSRQIGVDLGYSGMLDEAIVPLLCELPRPTFFTRDMGFDNRSLCDRSYCLVYLAIGKREVATLIPRFLRHPACSTFAQRRGAVVRVSHTGIHVWRSRQPIEETIPWVVWAPIRPR
jgi:hypothetical protein